MLNLITWLKVWLLDFSTIKMKIFFSLQFINNQDHVIILFTYNLLFNVLTSSGDPCLTQLSVQIIIILSTFLGTSAGKNNFLPFLFPLCIGIGFFGKYHYRLTHSFFIQCVVIHYYHYSFWCQMVPNFAFGNSSSGLLCVFDTSSSIFEPFLLSDIRCSWTSLPHILQSGISLRSTGSF